MLLCSFFFFFFNDTATTEIYTLSLHDALPISLPIGRFPRRHDALPHGRANYRQGAGDENRGEPGQRDAERLEEHTSELQSRLHLVCRLLLEKKKKTIPLPQL